MPSCGTCRGARQAGKRARIFLDFRWDSAAVHELALAAALDEAGVRENLEVVRNGGGGYAAKRHDFAAVHYLTLGDGLEDHQAGLVR